MRLYTPVPAGEYTAGDTLRVQPVETVAPETASTGAVAAVTAQVGETITEEYSTVLFDEFAPERSQRLLKAFLVDAVREEKYGSYFPSRFEAHRGYETQSAAVDAAVRDPVEVARIDISDPTGPFYSGHLTATSPAELLEKAEAYWDGVPAGTGPREYLFTDSVTVAEVSSAARMH